MDKSVRPEIYGVMSMADVESQLRRDKMPAPFIRRMRVINLLSALTLRKIEDNMIAPFEVMDIHHVLNEQISQDAIIAMLENKNLALALETGDLQPLWAESKEKPLLRKGFEQGWMQRFNKTPFDPICVMLAMRAKLMLDAVDELGHSYDLLRALGMGWIDFGEIPGEDPGDPDDYVPPVVDAPIVGPDLPLPPVPGDPDYVPGPGDPGYISPEDRVPGDPGYTPGPGDPGYISPGDIVPGEPGYVPGPDDQAYIPPPDRVPGTPGYGGVPGESPGYPEGWDEAIHPGHPDYDPGPGEGGYVYPPSPGDGLYGGDYGPGGEGTPGGPYGGGGDYASLLPPLPVGYGPGWLLAGRGFGIMQSIGLPACCLDLKTGPETVKIGGGDEDVPCGESTGLVVAGYHLECGGENYSWEITAGGGSLSANWGLFVSYTAPAGGSGCPGSATIALYCGGEVMDTVTTTHVCSCGEAEIGYTTQQMSVDEEQTLTVVNPEAGCEYSWEITAGGGGISIVEGVVKYTAPSSNENCEQNATITLKTGGNVCDALQIAIDAGGTVYQAYKEIYETVLGECSLSIRRRTFYCDGTEVESSGVPCDSCECAACAQCCCKFIYDPPGDCYGNWSCNPGKFYCLIDSLRSRCAIGDLCELGSCDAGHYDIRTEAAKTMGCCPAALL